MTSSGWVCLQVFAFQEKRVAAALLMRHGLATLLPTINHQFIIRGQKRSRLYPLFPGYLFLEMFAEKPISLYAFRFVEGYIRTLTVGGSDGVPAIMPKAFMADLQERIDAEGAFIVDPDQNKLLKGQRMRVKPDSGNAFSGLAAIVAETTHAERVQVLLSMFGSTRQVSIARGELESVD
jgi:transcription antitermination factor NusG